MSDNEIGAMMKGFRKMDGSTQKDFGDQCGLWGSDVCAYERGRRKITPGILERIKEAYPDLGRRIAKAMRQGNGADDVLPGFGMPRPKPEGKTIAGQIAPAVPIEPRRQIVVAKPEDVDGDELMRVCGIIYTFGKEFNPVPAGIYDAVYDNLIDVITAKEE